MLYTAQVPIAQSALLVIDAQDSFKVAPKWARRDNHTFETNVAALVDAYRAARLPIVFVLHTDPDPGFAVGDPALKLMDFLAPGADEPVLLKNTRNAFTSTNLAERLLEWGARRVVITGIQMEQCCETTARVAADLGYAVDFVTEATMTFPIVDRDDPSRELPVEAIRERTEFVLKGRFARMATVAGLVRELAEAGRSTSSAA